MKEPEEFFFYNQQVINVVFDEMAFYFYEKE